MKVKPTPTSPQAKLSSQQDIEELYRHEFQRLHKPPVASRLSWTTLIIALILGFLGGIVGELVLNAYFFGGDLTIQQVLRSNGFSADGSPLVRERTSGRELVDILNTVDRATLAIFARLPETGSTFPLYQEDNQRGSALLLSQDGWAVSDSSIVPSTGDFVAVTFDHKVLAVNKLLEDPSSDLVFFQIDGEGYPVVSLSNRKELQTTEVLLAVAQSGQTVSSRFRLLHQETVFAEQTDGISSSDEIDMRYLLDGSLADAYIGGPLVDLDGQVVGLLQKSVKASSTPAVPINVVRTALQLLLREGAIRRPVLGLHYIDVALVPGVPEAQRFRKNQGALIYGTTEKPPLKPGSPAERAGLKAGDLIVNVDNQSLDGSMGLSDLVLEKKPGEELNLTFLREGVEHKVVITLVDQR